MRAESKSARIKPRLGLARLISAMTAGRPASIDRCIAAWKPRTGGADCALRRISPSGTNRRASSTSLRLAARMRARMSLTSGGRRERPGELHELVQLGPRLAARDRAIRSRDAVPKARRDARDIQGGRRVEDDDVSRRTRFVREHGLDTRLRLRTILHLDRFEGRDSEPEQRPVVHMLGDETGRE